jgi:hypothetical protein
MEFIKKRIIRGLFVLAVLLLAAGWVYQGIVWYSLGG